VQAVLKSDEVKTLVRIYDEAIGSFSTRQRTTYTKVFEYMRPA
jgi:hypothetical protein